MTGTPIPKESIDRILCSGNEKCDDCRSILSYIDSLRARVEELTGEVREWLCDKCNTIYPGPPQKGFWCVQCPKCGGPTGPKYLIVNKRLRAELGAKQAEIDRLMLEYCPDEMTPEQIENWQKHQKPVLGEKT